MRSSVVRHFSGAANRVSILPGGSAAKAAANMLALRRQASGLVESEKSLDKSEWSTIASKFVAEWNLADKSGRVGKQLKKAVAV